MPPKNSPGWATSPVKGEHDISRIEDFVFPAANNVPSDRPLDDTQPDGPSINILGSPTRQSVSASSEVRAWRNLEPYPPRPLGNVVRSHHLRRSTHNADLRRQIMSSRDASSTAASAGSNAEEIQSGNENASLRALESLPLHSSGSSAEWFKPVNRDPPHRPLASLPLSGSSAEWFKPVNRNASRQYSLGWLPPSESADSVAALAEAVSRERVENWRYTATTLDQSLLRSPLSPRPFTQSDFQLGGWNESTNSVETAYKVDDTPRAHNSRPSGRVSRNLETDNPGYAALSMMEQAQEQARLGMDLPRLGLDAGKMMDTERVRRGPKLVPSPKGKSRARGDPVKKPAPLSLHSPIPKSASHKDPDPQTYTTHGLTLVLSKLYAPGLLPSDVISALPSPRNLSFLSDATMPTGYNAQFRSQLGAGRLETLKPKDRNYLAYYIDTLLQRNEKLGKENKRLDEDVEDKEVEKAMMQADVNMYYAENEAKKGKVERMGKLVKYLLRVVPEEKRTECAAVAENLGLDFGDIIRTTRGEEIEDGDFEKMVKGLRKVEEEARYWKARAEAAERFLRAME